MNKKFIIGGIAGVSTISLLTVGYILASNNNWFGGKDEETDLKVPLLTGPCSEGDITIDGYTEKGKQLKNCFVEYPGEPSRKSNDYYIVEDICGQFTQQFMETVSDFKFVQTKSPLIQSLYNCTYFINTDDGLTGDYLLVQLEYMEADNQKKGHEILGRTVTTDPDITMNNYVVYQEDGVINSILLILSDNKFIRIDRSSTVVSDFQLKNTAINIAKEIKEYK